jgi:VCBS repeat-containing protein
MDKSQIQAHIHQIEAEEQGIQATPASTRLVAVSQAQTPPIVDSTIIIQEPPLGDDEADPITHIPVQPRPRAALLLISLSLMLLLSLGLYFLMPLLFPSATVTIVPMEKNLSTTATIHLAAQSNQLTGDQIPGRLLPSLTMSQSETVKTTGVGHQNATEAQGTIRLYNGLLVSQVMLAGTIFTGADGIQVMTDQTAVIPAGNPPIYGQTTVPAHAIEPGSRGNIQAYDINTVFSASILAKNTMSFYGGQDARTYPIVAQQDIDNAVSHLKPSLTHSIQGAFTTLLMNDEALIAPTCHLTITKDKIAGEEATHVQVSVSQTCQAAAYIVADLHQAVTHLVNQEALHQYGTPYRLVGDLTITPAQTALTASTQEIATIKITATSRWVYQLGTFQKQQITHLIAGNEKRHALMLLSQMAGIQQTTVSIVGGYNDTLPQDAGRIQIVVIYQFI